MSCRLSYRNNVAHPADPYMRGRVAVGSGKGQLADKISILYTTHKMGNTYATYYQYT